MPGPVGMWAQRLMGCGHGDSGHRNSGRWGTEQLGSEPVGVEPVGAETSDAETLVQRPWAQHSGRSLRMDDASRELLELFLHGPLIAWVSSQAPYYVGAPALLPPACGPYRPDYCPLGPRGSPSTSGS